MNDQKNENIEAFGEDLEVAGEENALIRFCADCGNEIKEEELFCGSCGAKIKDFQTRSAKSKKIRFKGWICKNKKIIVAISICIVVMAILWTVIFSIMCLIAKDKVVGTWKSEQLLLVNYGGVVERYITLGENGEWMCLGIRVSDGEIVYAEQGSWYMTKMTVTLKEEDEISLADYKYHISDKLTNGNVEYKRTEVLYKG